MRVVILGAGLAGCSALYEAHRQGHEVVLLEATDRIGGLLQTEVIDTVAGRYTVDCSGGHWVHSSAVPEVRDLLEALVPGGWLEIDRHAACLLDGRPVPYPVQRNLKDADPVLVADYLRQLILNEYAPPASTRSFRQFLLQYFGSELCERFLFPYNEKVWRTELDRMAPDTQRVPTVTLEEVLRGVMGIDEGEVGYNASYVYPRAGGIATLTAALVRGLEDYIRLVVRAEQIDVGAKVVHTSAGRYGYDALVSTVPLPVLTEMLYCNLWQDGVSLYDVAQLKAIQEQAAGLRSVGLYVVCLGQPALGTSGPLTALPAKVQWIYVPQHFPFHRVGWASRAVDYLSPPAGESLYVEFGESPPPPVNVLDDLARLGVRGRHQPVDFYKTYAHQHAYPVSLLDTQQRRERILALLRESAWGIHVTGRHGRWFYDSMGECIADARQVVQQLVSVPALVTM